MSSAKTPPFDLETIRELAELLSRTGLTEIEWEQDDSRIRVARTPPPAMVAAGAAPVPLAKGADSVDQSEPEAWAGHPGLLTAPMVGVAYTAAEPGSPDFVRIGDSVAVGDTVLLIEAMKVFNPIKAHRAGRVSRVFVGNGVPVEYGEPLLLID